MDASTKFTTLQAHQPQRMPALKSEQQAAPAQVAPPCRNCAATTSSQSGFCIWILPAEVLRPGRNRQGHCGHIYQASAPVSPWPWPAPGPARRKRQRSWPSESPTQEVGGRTCTRTLLSSLRSERPVISSKQPPPEPSPLEPSTADSIYCLDRPCV